MDRIKNTNLSEKNEYGNNITDYELLTKLPWKKNTEKNPWKKVDGVIKKTKKKCKKWLAIDARHCLRMKKNEKRKYGRNWYQNMCKERKGRIPKRIQKKYSNNVLKSFKKYELKCVEVVW